jgi:diadenosine tetraphosphate (Ap4A) HIT family hydrolase
MRTAVATLAACFIAAFAGLPAEAGLFRSAKARLAPDRPPPAGQRESSITVGRRRIPLDEAHEIARQFRQHQLTRLRANARFFRKIAVDRDFSGEHVIHRDPEVTAFLDRTDPLHPRYDEALVEHTPGGIPPQRRAHVLVVPNQPREHIGPQVDGPITAADLAASLRVATKAEGLARDLKIKNPQVYINDANALGVGHLHVHIVGERTQPYPPPLPSP